MAWNVLNVAAGVVRFGLPILLVAALAAAGLFGAVAKVRERYRRLR